MTEILTTLGVNEAARVASVLMIFISVCALLTTLIVEALKSIPAVDRLPTKFICYIVAVILTPICFCAMMAFMKQPVEWFMTFASFLAAFIVAKVSMNGWDDVMELAERMIKR